MWNIDNRPTSLVQRYNNNSYDASEYFRGLVHTMTDFRDRVFDLQEIKKITGIMGNQEKN